MPSNKTTAPDFLPDPPSSDAFDNADGFDPSAAFEMPGNIAPAYDAQSPGAPLPPPAMIAEELPPFALDNDDIMPTTAPVMDAEEPISRINGVDQPVPRITIRGFCERPDTAALINQAASDRRLSRAHVQTELGGLPAAIEYFHDENTPNLIIIESGMRGPALFEQLEELANVCDAGTKVVLIGAANDIGLYRELMRRGISEYLVPPLNPLQLIHAVADIFIDPEQPFAGKVTAFIGAKGGVGASTIAHNTAWEISRVGEMETTIMDMDLSFGTVGLDFNQDGGRHLGDALDDPSRVDDVFMERLMTRCSEKLSLFTAPATLDREWELDPAACETVIAQVRAGTPHVILDLPHIWSPWVKNTLFAADDVVIVASPDLASLRNAKNLYDLVQAKRPNDAPAKIVINQYGMPKRPEIPIKDFADALGVEPVLVLPFEPQLFGQAANNGQMISEIKADAKCAEGFSFLAAQISGREMVTTRPSFVARLFGRG